MNSNFTNQKTLNSYFPTTNNSTGISPNHVNTGINQLATNNFSNNLNSNSIPPANAFNRSQSFSMTSNNLKPEIIDHNPFSTRNTNDHSNKFSSTHITSNNSSISYNTKNTTWGNTSSKNFY